MSETDVVIRVYVCPNPECGNYYGTSTMGHLEHEPNIAGGGSPRPGSVTSYRNRCPACGEARKERLARLIPEAEVATARRRVHQRTRPII